MPASNEEEIADVETQRNNLNVVPVENDDVEADEQQQEENDDVEEEDEQQQQQEDDDDSDSDDESSSDDESDGEEFVEVNLADIRKEVECAICLGILRKTRKVMECLHRFCRECIDKSMRLGNNECPTCRTHLASRRSLRDDPNFDAIIAHLFHNIDKYEAKEFTFNKDDKARNEQIQASIAETSQRQLEALKKKRANAKATAAAYMRRSQGTTRNLRVRRSRKSAEPHVSDSESDADENDNDDGGRCYSDDEPSKEFRPKRNKRWPGGPSSMPTSTVNGGLDETGACAGLVGSPEIPSWGGGGVRSNTRYGSQNSIAYKTAKNSQFLKLIDHLQKSSRISQISDELEIQLKLVSLDGKNIPKLQNLHICCKPTMSAATICQYVALENGLHASEVELLLVKGVRTKVNPPASTSEAEPSASSINYLTHELQPLERHQTLSDLVNASHQNQLTIVYKKKLPS